MNELEIRETSATIYEASQKIRIYSQTDLADVVEILKGVKKHREKIIEYWKSPKKSAKRTYEEIRSKEKEMLNVCDEIEKILKNEILDYKATQEARAQKLSDEAEKHRLQEVDKLLSESIEAQENSDEETAGLKLRQAEMIENMEKYTAKIFQKPDGVIIQRRWQVRIVDNNSVPAFFYGMEIREISTKKLLEIRSNNPNVQIPGVEFYQSETIAIKNIKEMF